MYYYVLNMSYLHLIHLFGVYFKYVYKVMVFPHFIKFLLYQDHFSHLKQNGQRKEEKGR